MLRDQFLAPILAGIRSPRSVSDRTAWNQVEHDYETIRLEMETLFDDLGIDTPKAA